MQSQWRIPAPAFALLLPLLLPLPAALARQPGADTSDQAMMAGMERMNQAMRAAPMTGDPDRDFVSMMIPHHEGAVDMARVELAYGKDPAMRRLAKSIIAAQMKEIREMQAWQKQHRGS